MHLLRQILILRQQQKSIRDITRSLALSRNTVRAYLRMLPDPGAPNSQQLTDEQLDQLIKTPPPALPSDAPLSILQQRFANIDRELTRPGVSRYSLGLDYKAEYPDGYQYTAPAARPVLPSLPALEPTPANQYAPKPQSGRQAICGLCR